jgi:hypothetical protein
MFSESNRMFCIFDTNSGPRSVTTVCGTLKSYMLFIMAFVTVSASYPLIAVSHAIFVNEPVITRMYMFSHSEFCSGLNRSAWILCDGPDGIFSPVIGTSGGFPLSVVVWHGLHWSMCYFMSLPKFVHQKSCRNLSSVLNRPLCPANLALCDSVMISSLNLCGVSILCVVGHGIPSLNG